MTQFNYIGQISSFMLTPEEAAIAGAAALGGGVLQGTTYIGSKAGMGDDISPQEAKKELVANTAAGLSSGVGGFLITRALNRKLGLV